MPEAATTYRLSPAWTVSQSGVALLVSGGADARYQIDLEAPGTSFFADLNRDRTFTLEQLGSEDRRILEQLMTAEVVVPVLAADYVLRAAVVGDVSDLALPAHDLITVVAPDAQPDLLVVVRTTSTYAQLLAALDYRRLATPHLLVDMAFHHTASLGPLVFPGETACIACLEGRIGVRWGDDVPPPRPQASAHAASLVAQLALHEVARIAQGDTSLTNKTVAWDLRERTVTTAQLLKVPLCPVCQRHDSPGHPPAGAISLPWSRE
ncbi:MAG: hypothetical protein CVT64_11010 [Actinobacteria bacterium HGW-Actinobacteria-4]|nr:MAG: hypothetical protein CVT64_11010 [Actinobacteria bacterium HGW-Actinobacteria-4]